MWKMKMAAVAVKHMDGTFDIRINIWKTRKDEAIQTESILVAQNVGEDLINELKRKIYSDKI